MASSTMELGIRTRWAQLGPCLLMTLQHYLPPNPHSPSPRPAQTAPALFYAWPGSAVTYTAERYSYGRVGQKETQVRCPPMLKEMGPLDQAGLHAYNYSCQLARPPTHSHTSIGPGICLSARFPTRGFMAAIFCLPACLPAWGHHQQEPDTNSPYYQPPSFLSKPELGSPGGASSHTSRALSGKLPEGREGNSQPTRGSVTRFQGDRGHVAPGTSA